MIFISLNIAYLITYVEDKPGHTISIADYMLKPDFFVEYAEGINGDKSFCKDTIIGEV